MSPENFEPVRIVHLQGGLRAIDQCEDHIAIQCSAKLPLAKTKRPAYKQLYSFLKGSGFSVIGVQMLLYQEHYDGLEHPEFETVSLPDAFAGRACRQYWSGLAQHAEASGHAVAADIGQQTLTYLHLLNIRLNEVSDAYSFALRKLIARDDSSPSTCISDFNLYRIQATVHALMADAVSFRDCMAKAIWRLVLREKDENVQTMGTLLKRTRNHKGKLVEKVQRCGAKGGWLKQMGELRDEIVHVAPLNTQHKISGYHKRSISPPNANVALPTLKYPLLQADGSLWNGGDAIGPHADDEAYSAAFGEYKAFADDGLDALDYCHSVVVNLAALAHETAVSTGLKSEMTVITDEDLLDKPSFR